MKRIVLTGAESTGKTTLARTLAAHLQTVWAPEGARHYLDARLSLDPNFQLSREDVLPIALAHRATELWLEPQANRVLVCDTDVLSTLLYARQLYDFVPDELERLLALRPATLYLLLDTDIEWHSDPSPGQRAGRESRAHFHQLFRQELERRELPFELVSAQGDSLARVQLALLLASNRI